MKTIILYNPLSGNGTGKQKAAAVEKFLKGKDISYEDLTKIKDWKKYFASVDAKDKVILCGGDGSLSRFANDVSKFDLKHDVYFFPVGSGNDFWRDLELPLDSEPLKINKYLEKLPTVEINGKKTKFINGIGYGIDGYCCEVADKIRETSDKPIDYTGIAIKGLLFHYKPTTATVTVDGKTNVYHKCWLAPTMNGRYYGGGMNATPVQNRLNKKRTVCNLVMHNCGKLKALIAFPNIFKGEHIKNKDLFVMTEGKKVTVAFDRPVALQIDGETVLNVTEYTVTTA